MKIICERTLSIKNEGRIMEVKDMGGLLNKEEVPVKKAGGSGIVVGAENTSIIPRSVKGVRSTLDQFDVKEPVEVKDVPESKKGQAWKDKITPEIVGELKKLKNFSVEVEINGEKQTKTGQDVLDAMGKLGKESLTIEQKAKEILEASMIHTKLMQKYEAGTEKGDELRGIFDNEVMGMKREKGAEKKEEMQNLFEQIASGNVTAINKLAEKMGVKLDETMVREFNGLIKALLPSGGVEAAPTITIDKDGKLTITPVPLPHEGEAGQVVPVPGEGGGIAKTAETPGTPGGKSKGSGDGEIKTTTEEEKKKFDWWKYGNSFLFLFICYLGVQGWYAKMWEGFAERAR